jgi:chromosome segregation ATPase
MTISDDDVLEALERELLKAQDEMKRLQEERDEAISAYEQMASQRDLSAKTARMWESQLTETRDQLEKMTESRDGLYEQAGNFARDKTELHDQLETTKAELSQTKAHLDRDHDEIDRLTNTTIASLTDQLEKAKAALENLTWAAVNHYGPEIRGSEDEIREATIAARAFLTDLSRETDG